MVWHVKHLQNWSHLLFQFPFTCLLPLLVMHTLFLLNYNWSLATYSIRTSKNTLILLFNGTMIFSYFHMKFCLLIVKFKFWMFIIFSHHELIIKQIHLIYFYRFEIVNFLSQPGDRIIISQFLIYIYILNNCMCF